MERTWVLLLACASVCPAQSLSVGLKGGVPLNNALKADKTRSYFSDKAPCVIGPAVELGLTAGLAAESGLLFRRVEYGAENSRTRGESWEIPLLVKYRAAGVLSRPFLLAGVSFRRLARFEQKTAEAGSSLLVEVTDHPEELKSRFTAGPTVGAGLEFHLPRVRLSAEFRYTRWGGSGFRSPAGGLSTQLNQADLLLGIMF